MKRLGRAALPHLPAGVARPRSDRRLGTGVVHFGPGAFHRAHQAEYVDRLVDDDPRWGIAAVSLRTRGTVDALAAQDGCYALAIRDVVLSWRVLAAHAAFLGPEDGPATLALLADPAVAMVTATVTEKGYCLGPDGTLDRDHPDVVADLADPSRPRSLVGWLVAGLAARRAAGIAPFAPVPCDNMADNGAKLRAALMAFADARDPGLARWIAGEVRVPSTMVDAITPASDEQLLADAQAVLGVRDEAPVQREAFAQWVVEDVGLFSGDGGPDLRSVGVAVTGDVAGFERAKLRVLNGAHSTLAYGGLLRGRASVAEAVADAPLAGWVRAMVEDEVLPTLPRMADLDLPAYTRAVFGRFRNPAIVHRLEQIAQDGSQKLPYRLADTLAARRREGAPPGRLAAALGLWAAFLFRRAREGEVVIDPRAAALARACAAPSPAEAVDALMELGVLVSPELVNDAEVRVAVRAAADDAVADRWDQLFACR